MHLSAGSFQYGEIAVYFPSHFSECIPILPLLCGGLYIYIPCDLAFGKYENYRCGDVVASYISSKLISAFFLGYLCSSRIFLAYA